MVALKGADIDAYIAKPDARPVVLIYGTDAGLVRERAESLLRVSVDDPHDPFTLARFEADTVSGEPQRLLEEAHTVPLFGGRRAISIRAGTANIAAAVEAVLADPPGADCRVIIEAGDLRKTAPLRTLCERAKGAVVLPCYADTEQALARLIVDELRQDGLTIAPDAQTLLASLLGGDRQASRSEIRKLALYARGKGQVDIDDVLAVVADASALVLDTVVDAAFAGQVPQFDRQFARARMAGVPPGTILSAAGRQAAQLHRARLVLETGRNAAEAIRDTFRPPLFFRREPAVKSALGAWTSSRLEAVMTDLSAATLAARRWPTAAETTTHRALLATAMKARRAG